MTSSPSLAGRAALAVMLMLGFYVLALAIAGGLIYIPYAEWTYAGRLHLKLALFCTVAAGTILWSIVPRPERFIPPGPVLEPHEQPQLFRLLTSIANTTNEEMPAAVYVIPDMNAWVTHHGGIMGFGGRRMMGLGLPLLQVLSVTQLRAVLAHEFGHFHGGNTTLGPWLYKTRAAIDRTLQGLAERSSVLQKPFIWYGKAFLRITYALSRRQEFAADALAARIVGARPLIEGLKLAHAAAPAFNAYWRDAMAPMLGRGFQPPMAEGFRRYLAAPDIAAAVSIRLNRDLGHGEANAYDTHPPLQQRLEAMQHWPQGEGRADDPPSISLLRNIDVLEARLLGCISSETTAQGLRPVAWDEVERKVWIPEWQDIMRKYGAALSGVATQTLPELAQDLDALSRRLGALDGVDLAPEEHRQTGLTALGIALAVALHGDGWELHVRPGEDPRLEHEGNSIKPFDITLKLASGELTAEAWRELCVTFGIMHLDLAGQVASFQQSSQ